MKKILYFATLMILISFSGCYSEKKITENEFKILWSSYVASEFEESFDGKQSIEQRVKLLKNISDTYNIDFDALTKFMQSNHPDKYNAIYHEK